MQLLNTQHTQYSTYSILNILNTQHTQYSTYQHATTYTMSIVGLRVDTCDHDSPSTLISHCLCNRESLVTLLLCLQRTRIHIPRDLRRLIAIYCTVPTPSMMVDNSANYYKFYFSHPTTRKYNPFIYDINRLNDSIISVMVHLVHSKHGYSFRHPYPQYLPGPGHPESRGCMTAGLGSQLIIFTTCKVLSNPPRYVNHGYVPHAGFYIVGIEQSSSIIAASIYNYPHYDDVDECSVTPVTMQPLPVLAFQLPNRKVTDIAELESSYRPGVQILPLATLVPMTGGILYYLTVISNVRITHTTLIHMNLNVGSVRE